MNILDIIIIIILAWGAFRGFMKGFILQIVTFIALIVGIWASIQFSDSMTTLLNTKLDITGKYVPVLAFFLIFVFVIIVAQLIGWALTKIFELTGVGWLNKLGGVVFGVLKMAFIISVFLAVISGVREKTKIISDKQIETSLLYKPVASMAPVVFPHLKFKYLEERFREITTKKK